MQHQSKREISVSSERQQIVQEVGTSVSVRSTTDNNLFQGCSCSSVCVSLGCIPLEVYHFCIGVLPLRLHIPSWSHLPHDHVSCISPLSFLVYPYISPPVCPFVSLYTSSNSSNSQPFLCVSFYIVCSSNYLKFWHNCHLAKTNCDQHRLVCGLLLHRSLLHPPAGIAAEKNWTQALDGFVCRRRSNLINKQFVLYFSYW